jgi:tubulin monoglycylase TTLL3/8
LARNETKKKEETITDFNVFRKKHGITPDIKIFIIRGGYGTLRKALVERGWYENPDKESPVFDFKFAIKSDNPAELKDFQITNHFMKNNVITTKVGLCHSLKNLIWWNNVEVDTFFPKCFDLTDGAELEDFKQEYRFQRAESILRTYAMNPQSVQSIEKLIVAISLCEKRLKDVDD